MALVEGVLTGASNTIQFVNVFLVNARNERPWTRGEWFVARVGHISCQRFVSALRFILFLVEVPERLNGCHPEVSPARCSKAR